MSRKFLVSVDLNKNELLNPRVQNLASAPSSPVSGQIYYDTTLGKFGVYNGATWDYMGTSSATGDVSSNTATAVDSEIALFSGTGGKTIKRATTTGILKGTSGVLSAATEGTDYYGPGGTDVAVTDGGTGRSTGGTAYGLIAAGTTATGAQQTISPGTSGQFLKSAGAGALASFAAIAESDVTNLVTDLAAKAPLASPTFTGTVTVPTPTNATDAATKGYVDNAVQGLSWKQAVRVATTTNGTLASAYENGDTIDGVTLATGDRILIKDQSTGSENGIYTVNASGAPTRALDANTSAEVDSMTVYVEQGTANADTVWTLTTNDPTLDSTALVFAQINGGAVPQATTTTQGKVELATQAEAEAKTDPDRAVTPASLATFARKYTGTIGNGSATSIAVTHGLGTQYVTAQVFDATSNLLVECDITLTSSTQTTFDFAVAPTTNQYRVVITG